MTKRARNLSSGDVENIVAILEGWTGSLTWAALVAEIERQTGESYTRQALHRHSRINAAFCKSKGRRAGTTAADKVSSTDSTLGAALAKIKSLTTDNERLEKENTKLLGQFARWAYNAHTRGVEFTVLDRPLPPALSQQGKLASPKVKSQIPRRS
jgi:hypothetical protein